MSIEWELQSAESWKVSFPCSRAEGEALATAEPELGIEPPPTVMTSEPDPARPDAWQLDIYLSHPPDAALIAAIRTLVPSASGVAPTITKVEDADWITLSQGFLEPIRAGRFFVHTAAHAETVPPDMIAFQIEASRAFGTGHHETTSGCLEALDLLAAGGKQFQRIADVGTGTGLLAFAARALWPKARILASDIDPIAIAVTAENMAVNHIAGDAILLVTADGVDSPLIRGQGPFDLIIANILAGPLIALAADLVQTIDRNGTIVLAGLLAIQADDVLTAYIAQGMVLTDRIDQGDWSILTLVQGR